MDVTHRPPETSAIDTKSAEPGGSPRPASTAETLSRLWSEIADVTVDTQAAFIDFTDSMSATEYVNRVRETFDVDIPATALFDRIPNIARLAQLIDANARTATASAAVAPAAPARPAPSTRDRNAALPAHAIGVAGGDWSAWRTIVVRGTGFPVTMVRDLAGQAATAAADDYAARCQAVVGATHEAITALDRSIGSAGGPESRAAFRKIRRKLRSGVVRTDGATAAEQAVTRALAARDAARVALEAAYAADWQAAVALLRRMLHDDRCREALLWQKNQAVPTIARRLDAAEGSDGDRRNAALFVAMNVQRYATKNDTIGFFGPVGWGSLVDGPTIAALTPGPALLARREVYFEGWAIDALADRLGADPAIKPWLRPRRKAGVWMAADAVYVPMIGAVALSDRERRVLACCDGVRSARAIAADLIAEPDRVAATEADVFDAIEQLVVMKLAVWQLEVAPQRFPEWALRDIVAGIEEAEVRERCEAAVRALTDARARVADAAGDCAALETTLADLDETFARVTGSAPSRRAGEMYAGRGVVFEDCRRDCAVSFGEGFLQRLGPPLSIVLDGARWVTGEFRRAFGRHLRKCHADLESRSGSAAVDAHLFLTYVGMGARDALAPISAAIRQDYRDRWRDVLARTPGERSIARATADLRARASAAFPASGPSSWGGYFTPDIMIAARGLAALQRGDFQCVLGEVHSSNTLLWSCLTSQHPDFDQLERALTEDASTEDLVLVQVPKSRWLSRLDQMTVPPVWRYEHGDDLPARASCRSLPAGLLYAVDDGTGVRVRARDGRVDFDAYDLFAVTLSYEADRIVSDGFSGEAHTPRITIDNVIVAREQWQMRAGEMAFLHEKQRPLAFAQIRAWASAHGMPRHVFYKSAGETKPCYLDFDSPLYVEAFLKLIRRLRPTASVKLVEMVPSPEQTWLTDADGAPYTCELRIAMRTASDRPQRSEGA